MGLRFEHVFRAIDNEHIHLRLKTAYLGLAKVLFVDVDPFSSLLRFQNRCYFWGVLDEGRIDRTMTEWEKSKIAAGNDRSDGLNHVDEYRNHVKDLRLMVLSYFDEAPTEIGLMLLNVDQKLLQKRDYVGALKNTLQLFQLANALIEF